MLAAVLAVATLGLSGYIYSSSTSDITKIQYDACMQSNISKSKVGYQDALKVCAAVIAE